MKFRKLELDRMQNPRIDISEEFVLDPDLIEDHPRCLAVRDIFVDGQSYYDHHSSRFMTDLLIEGIMDVPCAITLKPVELAFSFQLDEVFSFVPLGTGEEGVKINGDLLDLVPYIAAAIIAEIPLKVVDPDLDEYPKGSGWEVMTEEDYIKDKSQELDPRLAKLKDFKLD